jgi:hypothetical protein
MSREGEPEFYQVDIETFAALRRIVRRLFAYDPLAGEDRRNLAIRMNSLLQRTQAEHHASDRRTIDSDHWASSSLLKESFWKHRAHS